jgi:hypothetical protein
MSEISFPNPEEVLNDHGFSNLNPEMFSQRQLYGGLEYGIHMAHHAKVEITQDESSGLFYVKKTFGERERKIPFRVAGELADDYVVHAKRLKEIGVSVAGNYGLRVRNDDGLGVITVHQLLFPEGTLLDWFTDSSRSKEQVADATRASIRDALVPVLGFGSDVVSDPQSWVFTDSAPKNVAPVQDGEKLRAFYFDFFVPRVRNSNGEIKAYPGYELHTRPEEDMQKRFFTKNGILNSFLAKAHSDLIDIPTLWDTFSAVSSQELNPYLDKYFPNKTVDEVAGMNFRQF